MGIHGMTLAIIFMQVRVCTIAAKALTNFLQGNFKQLYALKLKHRTIKVLLSIGGWTYSQAGHFNFVTSASARATFVNSSIALMEDNGLDGM